MAFNRVFIKINVNILLKKFFKLLKPFLFSLGPPTSLDLGLQLSGLAFLQSALPSLNPDSLFPQASKITFSSGFLQKNSSVLHMTSFPLLLFRSVSWSAGKLRARMRIMPGFFICYLILSWVKKLKSIASSVSFSHWLLRKFVEFIAH